MLLLTACASARIETIKPPPERLSSVDYPEIPKGTTSCPDAPEKRCLSDAETGKLLLDFSVALDAANAKLQWLRDYFDALPD